MDCTASLSSNNRQHLAGASQASTQSISSQQSAQTTTTDDKNSKNKRDNPTTTSSDDDDQNVAAAVASSTTSMTTTDTDTDTDTATTTTTTTTDGTIIAAETKSNPYDVDDSQEVAEMELSESHTEGLIVESWLDRNPAFLQDYLMRKAAGGLVDNWLNNQSRSVAAPSKSSPDSSRHSEAGDQLAAAEIHESAGLEQQQSQQLQPQQHRRQQPVRRISTHDFETSIGQSFLGPMVSTTPDGRPTFFLESPPSEDKLASSLDRATRKGLSSAVRLAELEKYIGKLPANSVIGRVCSETSDDEFTWVDEMKLIFELVKDICDDLDIRTLLHKILKNILVLINADKSSLFLVSGKPHEASRHLVSHLFDVDQESEITDQKRPLSTNRDDQESAGIKIPWGTGIVGYVAQTGEAVNIANCYEDPRFTSSIDQKTGYKTSNMLCAPIFDKRNEIVGVAQVINKRDGKPFSKADELKFKRYLQFCGIGLRNAHSYEKSQLENRRNQVLLDLARMVFEEQSSVERVVHRIMLHTQSLFECQRCQVLLLDETYTRNLDHFARATQAQTEVSSKGPLTEESARRRCVSKQRSSPVRLTDGDRASRINQDQQHSVSASNLRHQRSLVGPEVEHNISTPASDWRPRCSFSGYLPSGRRDLSASLSKLPSESPPTSEPSRRLTSPATNSDPSSEPIVSPSHEIDKTPNGHQKQTPTNGPQLRRAAYYERPGNILSHQANSSKLFSHVFDLECDGTDVVMHNNNIQSDGQSSRLEELSETQRKQHHHQQQRQSSDTRKNFSSDSSFPINIGITGYVAVTGKVLNIEDAHKCERFDKSVDNNETNTNFRHKSLLCMPIRNGQRQIIGVILLINKRNGRPFNKNDENLLEAFAIFCGLGIQNTLMYEQVLKIMAKQRVTFEVLSYHATAPLEEAIKLNQEQVPSCYALNLRSLKFNDFSLDDQFMLKSCLRFFIDLDLVRHFQIDQLVLCNWLLSVQKNYRTVTYHPSVGGNGLTKAPVRYHNWRHAFNVSQMMFAILVNTKICQVLGGLETLALMISCLSHDLDHRGTTNSFQIKSASPLAELYSTSTMEHHHFDQCVMILNSTGNQILANLSPEDYARVIELLEEAILATDLANYFNKREQFFKLVESNQFDWRTNEDHRALLRCMLMTACDVAAITKPWPVQKVVADLVMSEFHQQGDIEKSQLNMEPIDMMNRDKMSQLPKMQIGFIDSICAPIYKAFAMLFPRELTPLLEGCLSNREIWLQMAKNQQQ